MGKLLRQRMCNFTVTGWCNAKCVFCHYPGVKERPAVKLDDAKRAIDALIDLDVGVLSLTGGEPFLNHDLPEIAGYATSRGLTVFLGTNGTMLHEDVVRRLAAAKVQAVWVSYEGPDAATFDKNRGVPGLTEKIRIGLATLKKAGIEPFCICMINRTISDYRAFIDHVMSLGYTTVKFDYPQRAMQSSYLAFSDWNMLEMSAEQMRDAIDQILAIKKERYRGVYIMNVTEGLEGAKRFWRQSSPKYPCHAGDSVLYLDVNLDLYRCTVLAERFGKVWDVRPEQLERIECNKCYYQGVRDYDSLAFLFSSIVDSGDLLRGGHPLRAAQALADRRTLGGLRSAYELALRR